ncbi:MAG: thioredoxin-dependent thiol peroxidase [Bacteroidetes bacterium]|nr:thioredoxin-dependent thiol peroxidase [Bacteroidota bacterium]
MNLKIGDKAPDFIGKDQDGNNISLKDFKGKKLVLYFYPRDNTPGCTFQACNLRDNYKEFEKQGYIIVGISSDSQKSHKKFIENKKLPFNLIADEDHSIHEKYGTWVEKKFILKKYMGTARKTFVIDKKGIISDIIEKVKTRDHSTQMLS